MNIATTVHSHTCFANKSTSWPWFLLAKEATGISNNGVFSKEYFEVIDDAELLCHAVVTTMLDIFDHLFTSIL